jgi:hypothetical protein
MRRPANARDMASPKESQRGRHRNRYSDTSFGITGDLA